MKLQTMFFDVGGTLETYSCTSDLRIANTSVFRHTLVEHGIELQISDEELYETIVSGISAYRKWSIGSMIELNTAEIWNDYVFKDFQVEREVLSEISEQLSYLY